MLTMYDSTDPSVIPRDPAAVAGYINGRWPTYDAIVRRFPHARHLSITIDSHVPADVLDIEKGDALPEEAGRWVKLAAAHGIWRPCPYAPLSMMPAVIENLNRQGLGAGHRRLWVADWTGHAHLPQGFDACQFTDRALGRNLDESLCSSHFFRPAATRPIRWCSAEVQYDPDGGHWRVHSLPINARPLGG